MGAMTSLRKNILVGITVLGAFVILGWMIIKFGGDIGGLLGPRGYKVVMNVERVEGLAEGNKVRYLGSGVGRVESIEMADSKQSFIVELSINNGMELPGNVTGVVRAINLISGGAAVDLELQGDTVEGTLTEGQEIPGSFAGASLLPPEVAGLADRADRLLMDLQESGLIANLNDQVTRLGNLVEDINTLVDDEDLQNDVRTTLASARDASASFARTAEEIEAFAGRLDKVQDDVDVILADARDITGDVKTTVKDVNANVTVATEDVTKLTKQMATSMETLNGVLADMRSITQKIDAGEGTAGKLVNDDRAYALLVDNMRVMQSTLTTLERLIQQWEENGINLDF